MTRTRRLTRFDPRRGDVLFLTTRRCPIRQKETKNEQPGYESPGGTVWTENRESFIYRRPVPVSSCVRPLGEAQARSTTKCKRGRRAFPALCRRVASSRSRPPSIRFSFIATKRGEAVYVFAATRSKEATSSFTLEMKALHRGEQEDERERGSGFLLERPIKPFCILLSSAQQQPLIFFFSQAPGSHVHKTSSSSSSSCLSFSHSFPSSSAVLSVSAAIFLLPFTPRSFLLFHHL